MARQRQRQCKAGLASLRVRASWRWRFSRASLAAWAPAKSPSLRVARSSRNLRPPPPPPPLREPRHLLLHPSPPKPLRLAGDRGSVSQDWAVMRPGWSDGASRRRRSRRRTWSRWGGGRPPPPTPPPPPPPASIACHRSPIITTCMPKQLLAKHGAGWDDRSHIRQRAVPRDALSHWHS